MPTFFMGQSLRRTMAHVPRTRTAATITAIATGVCNLGIGPRIVRRRLWKAQPRPTAFVQTSLKPCSVPCVLVAARSKSSQILQYRSSLRRKGTCSWRNTILPSLMRGTPKSLNSRARYIPQFWTPAAFVQTFPTATLSLLPLASVDIDGFNMVRDLMVTGRSPLE